MVNYRLENHTAKGSDEIDHKIRITYRLYSLKHDGDLRSKLGESESLDRLMKKCQRYLHKDTDYVVRKVVIETKEEPVFKVKISGRKK